MTIPLPPLPDKIPVDRHIPTGVVTYGYTQEMMRAIQREAMRVALEAAARECDRLHAETKNNPERRNALFDAAAALRALEIGT